MHRKENCSIPRLDLLDQSKFYIQHTKKLKKSKPVVNTSSITPVNHFSVAHKEKEKEWKYADYISKLGYNQIRESKNQNRNKRSFSHLSSSRKDIYTDSNDFYPNISNSNILQRPQFNLRTNIFPSSPKGGIYNYRASFDFSSLSASGMLSRYLSANHQIEDDESIASASSSVFLTQQKHKNYKKYQYSNLDNPRIKQKINDETYEVSVKDGMKCVVFSSNSIDNSNSREELASKLNSRLRKTFFIGPANSQTESNIDQSNFKSKSKNNSDIYSLKCDLQFDFQSNIKKDRTKYTNKKSRKSHFINNFENIYKVGKDESLNTKSHKRIVKLKILQSFLYESFVPKEQISIIWADQNDLISQDDLYNIKSINDYTEKSIGFYANYIDAGSSDLNTTRTSVNFTLDDDDTQIILEQSPLEFFEFFELEVSSSQHVLDIALNDSSQSENDLNEEKTEVIGAPASPKNDINKLEILPKQLINLFDDPKKENANDNNNSEYSYYSEEEI